MNSPNLKRILEMITEDQPQPLTKQEKQEFTNQVKRFSEMNQSVYGNGDLQSLTDRVKDMINKAEQITTELEIGLIM